MPGSDPLPTGPFYGRSSPPFGCRRPIGVPLLSLDTTPTREDALRLYDALDVPDDRVEYLEVDDWTHMVHLERRRHALYDAVYGFQQRAYICRIQTPSSSTRSTAASLSS